MLDAMIRWTFSRGTPLSTGQRVDLELLTRRTIEVLGAEWLRQRELQSTHHDPVKSPNELWSVAQPIAQQLGVSEHFGDHCKAPLQWNVMPTEEFQAAFHYRAATNDSPAAVELPQHVLNDPLRLTTTMATGIARHVWEQLGTRSIDRDIRMASLLPILGGMGPLIADAALYDNQWKTVGYAGWTLSRMGQFNAMETGYVMALRARLIGVEDLEWIDFLRLDANATARQAMRHFRRREADQQPLLVDATMIPSASHDPQEFARWISNGPIDFSLSAARVLHHRFQTEQVRVHSTELSEAILRKSTTTKDIELRAALAQLIGVCQLEASQAMAALLKLSKQRHPSISLAALESANAIGLSPEPFLPAARRLLESESFDLLPVLQWVGDVGPACRPFSPLLGEHLREAIKWEDEAGINATAKTLCRIDDDPIETIRRSIKDVGLYEKAKQRLEFVLAEAKQT